MLFAQLSDYLIHDPLLQDKPPALQSILSGELIISSSKDLNRQGHKERALIMLHQMIEDAHMGKRQFLSGNHISNSTAKV